MVSYQPLSLEIDYILKKHFSFSLFQSNSDLRCDVPKKKSPGIAKRAKLFAWKFNSSPFFSIISFETAEYKKVPNLILPNKLKWKPEDSATVKQSNELFRMTAESATFTSKYSQFQKGMKHWSLEKQFTFSTTNVDLFKPQPNINIHYVNPVSGCELSTTDISECFQLSFFFTDNDI